MHLPGIRKSLRDMFTTVSLDYELCPGIFELLVNIYLNMRLFYHIKFKNRAIRGKRKSSEFSSHSIPKKQRKLSKLQHTWVTFTWMPKLVGTNKDEFHVPSSMYVLWYCIFYLLQLQYGLGTKRYVKYFLCCYVWWHVFCQSPFFLACHAWIFLFLNIKKNVLYLCYILLDLYFGDSTSIVLIVLQTFAHVCMNAISFPSSYFTSSFCFAFV